MTEAAAEILLASVMVPVMVACFAVPLFVTAQGCGHCTFTELRAVLLVLIVGDGEQKRRLRAIINSRNPAFPHDGAPDPRAVWCDCGGTLPGHIRAPRHYDAQYGYPPR